MIDGNRFKSLIGDPVWPNDCWPWLGTIGQNGYGHFNIHCVPNMAHRVAYQLFVGPILKKLIICHDCDRRDCVNPHHLFMGTHTDNMNDMLTKNRGTLSYPGEKSGRAGITELQAIEIIQMGNNGYTINEIAVRMNTTYDTVYPIVKGMSWKHLLRLEKANG